jgi:hypothetical protein
MMEFPHMSFWPRNSGQLVLLVFDLVVGFFLAVTIHEVAIGGDDEAWR